MLHTDPLFYLIAIPAVLIMGISKSGFGGGFGALVVPMMAMAVTVPEAAAIMMPILLVMDLLGLKLLIRQCNWGLVKLLVPAGLFGILVGWALFGLLSAPMLSVILGFLTLTFLAQRLIVERHPHIYRPLSRPWGWFLGVLGGLSSFIAHAGSPPLNAYVIPLRLKPVEFAATFAVFFGIINLSKWIPYSMLGLLDLRNLVTSLVLMPLAPLGVWIGVKIATTIPEKRFYKLLYLGMLLTGIKLLSEIRVYL